MRLITVNANASGRNLSHSERSISSSMVEHTMITTQELRRRSRAIRRPFWICSISPSTHQLCILKVVWSLAPRKSVICLVNSYNEHIPMMSGCLLILAQNTCHLLACFSALQMKHVLQDFDFNKGSGPNCIPPIILKNCASAFAKPLSLLFTRSMATSVFPNRRKVSYVTPILKEGRRNNVDNYRGVAILTAISKRLLVSRGMYNDLKNLMYINQHGFMINRSTITNL
jgi:hypothetical protein